MDPSSKFRTSRIEISIPFRYKQDSLRLKISIPNDSNNIESRVYFSVFNSKHPSTSITEIPYKIKKILKSKNTKKYLDEQLIDTILKAKNNINKITTPTSDSSNIYKLLPIPSMSPPLSRRASFDALGSKPTTLRKSVSFSGENEIIITRISGEFSDEFSKAIIKEFLVVSVIEFSDLENEKLKVLLNQYSEFNQATVKKFIKQEFFPLWLLDLAKENLLKEQSKIVKKIIDEKLTEKLSESYVSGKLNQFSIFNFIANNNFLQFVRDVLTIDAIICHLYVDLMEFYLTEFFKTISFDVPLNSLNQLFSSRISSFVSGKNTETSIISYIENRLFLLKNCNSIDDDKDQIVGKFIELNPDPEPYVDLLKQVISRITTDLPHKLLQESIDFIKYLKKNRNI